MISVLWERFGVVFTFAIFCFVTFLIHRFDGRKQRIRRTFLLFVFAFLAWGVQRLFPDTGSEWDKRFDAIASVLRAYTVISVSALFLFDLFFPLIRVRIVSITTDVLVGIAYIIATAGLLPGGNVQSVLATSAVVSAVLAISLQATLGNILGGIALQLDGSVHVGDWIQLENGRQGRVREIRWRHAVLETRDWSTLIVPNSQLLAGQITILGKRSNEPLQQRYWVQFNVDFRHAPDEVVRTVTEALQNSPIDRVASEPKPHCICLDLAAPGRDSFAVYAVRYWLTDLAHDEATNSVIRGRIFAALKRAQIPLAKPAATMFEVQNNESLESAEQRRRVERRYHALRSVELFSALTEEELRVLAGRVKHAPFSKGETITKQGATAHWLYIQTQGLSEVRVRDGEHSRTVATLESPNFFGEMGLMTGEPRLCDVVAMSDVECFRLDKESFQDIVKDRPEIAKHVSETLAKRSMELSGIKEDLDNEASRSRHKREQEAILAKIEDFFGL